MEVQVAPLRPWEDFFPSLERFARPDFRDVSKWNNRVVSNLLYYQTNYLLLAAAVISIVGQGSQKHYDLFALISRFPTDTQGSIARSSRIRIIHL